MIACTFCGLLKDEVSSLVAGPGVNICDGCVAFAESVIGEADETVAAGGSPGDMRCSFCDQSAQRARRLVAGPGAGICEECLRAAGEAIANGAGFVGGA